MQRYGFTIIVVLSLALGLIGCGGATPAPTDQPPAPEVAAVQSVVVNDVTIQVAPILGQKTSDHKIMVELRDSNQQPIPYGSVQMEVIEPQIALGQAIVQARNLVDGSYAFENFCTSGGTWRVVVNANVGNTPHFAEFVVDLPERGQ